MSWTKHRQLPSNWPAIVRSILARDKRCMIAGPNCTGRAEQADHIVNWAEGGSDHPSNLQAACVPCHSEKTKAEAARGRARAPKARRTPERHPGLT